MALSENITLAKTVNNVYFADVLGIFQHLTQEKIQKMLQYPSNEWTEQGIIEEVKVEKIPRKNDTKAIQWYQQIVERGGIRIDSANGAGYNSNNIIVAEGALTRHNNIGFVADEQIGKQGPNGVKKSYGCYFESSVSMCAIYIYQATPSGTLYARWTMSNSVTGVHTAYQFHNNSWGDSDRDSTFNNSWDCADYNWYINGVLMGSYISPFELPCPVSNCELTVVFSGRLFKDSQSMARYKSTGDDSGDLTKGPAPETPAEDRKATLFFNSTIYRKRDGQAGEERVGASSVQFIVQYKSNDGTEKIPAERQVAGYVNNYAPINQSTWGNIVFKKSKDAKLVQVKARWTDSAGVSHELIYQPLNYPFGVKLYGFYGNWRDGDYLYYSKYGTNMMIYANESDLDRYQEGDPTVKPLVDGHVGRFQPEEIIGDPTVYNSQSYELKNDMSSVWVLTQSQLDDLASVFSTGLLRDEALEDGVVANVTKTAFRSFLAHGEPIDAVCDLFWVPIDPLDFVDSHSDTMEFAVDRYGILETVAEVSDTFGERYSVSKSIGYNIALGPGASAVNNLKKIADSFESVVGPKDQETENVIHQGQYHNSQSSIQ